MSEKKGINPIWWVVIGVILLASLFRNDNPTTAVPTEREKQEAGARAILEKYGRANQSKEEINQGAKAIIDEWEKVQK